MSGAGGGRGGDHAGSEESEEQTLEGLAVSAEFAERSPDGSVA